MLKMEVFKNKEIFWSDPPTGWKCTERKAPERKFENCWRYKTPV